MAVPVGHWMLQSLEQMLQVSRNASHSSWKWTFQLRHPPQPTLTVLAALTGVAGRAQTGSGGGVTAGVVGTVGADLLAARSPETLRASWSMSRQRTHSTGIRAQVAEGNVCPRRHCCAVQGRGLLFAARGHQRAQHGRVCSTSSVRALCQCYSELTPGFSCQFWVCIHLRGAPRAPRWETVLLAQGLRSCCHTTDSTSVTAPELAVSRKGGAKD